MYPQSPVCTVQCLISCFPPPSLCSHILPIDYSVKNTCYCKSVGFGGVVKKPWTGRSVRRLDYSTEELMIRMTDQVKECSENSEKELVAFGDRILERVWESD